jgi:hypothetical protein
VIPLRLVGSLAGVLIVVGAVHAVLRAERAKGRAECEAVYASAEVEARVERDRLAVRAENRQKEIVDAYRQTVRSETGLRDAARRELERVRIAAAAVGDRAASSPAGAASGADGAGGLERLLAEGAELVEEGRGRIAGLAAKVTALQEVATQCAAPPTSP